MLRSRIVFAAQAVSLVLLAACALVLGMFAMMAESGGKESRPDLLVPLILALLVIVFGVRREARSPSAVALLLVCSAALGWAPCVVPSSVSWPSAIGFCWWCVLLSAASASLLSWRGPGEPSPGNG